MPDAPALPQQLLHHLAADDLDGAVQAGLMDYAVAATDGLDTAQVRLIADAQQRLHGAWAARERYRARAERLARRAAEREARRAPPPAADSKPTLPSAAAAILARAKARAAGKPGA